MNFRQARLQEISKEIGKLDHRRYSLLEERAKLMLAEALEDHPCRCVQRNGDIGVFDMQDQEALQRNPLGLGLVSETLSAAKHCPVCKGTGKPEVKT